MNVNAELKRMLTCVEKDNLAEFFEEGQPWNQLFLSFARTKVGKHKNQRGGAQSSDEASEEEGTNSRQEGRDAVVGTQDWFNPEDVAQDVIAEFYEHWQVLRVTIRDGATPLIRLRRVINNLVRNALNRFRIQATKGMGRKGKSKTHGPSDPTDPAFGPESNPFLDQNKQHEPRPVWKSDPQERFFLDQKIKQLLDRTDRECALRDRVIWKMDISYQEMVRFDFSPQENDWRPPKPTDANTAGKVYCVLLAQFPSDQLWTWSMLVSARFGLANEPKDRKPETSEGPLAPFLAKEFKLAGRDPVGTVYQWLSRARNAYEECLSKCI